MTTLQEFFTHFTVKIEVLFEKEAVGSCIVSTSNIIGRNFVDRIQNVSTAHGEIDIYPLNGVNGSFIAVIVGISQSNNILRNCNGAPIILTAVGDEPRPFHHQNGAWSKTVISDETMELEPNSKAKIKVILLADISTKRTQYLIKRNLECKAGLIVPIQRREAVPNIPFIITIKNTTDNVILVQRDDIIGICKEMDQNKNKNKEQDSSKSLDDDHEEESV